MQLIAILVFAVVVIVSAILLNHAQKIKTVEQEELEQKITELQNKLNSEYLAFDTQLFNIRGLKQRVFDAESELKRIKKELIEANDKIIHYQQMLMNDNTNCILHSPIIDKIEKQLKQDTQTTGG